MMFGHDDQQTQDATMPAPDSTLGQDNTASTPPVVSDGGGDAPASTPASGQPTSYMEEGTEHEVNIPATTTDTNLMHIKQQALSQLSPLLGHLEQTPEEKFRTMMMLIQASDNDKLIPQAYEAAQAITDEKARAQALLDVVNEINYFTQQAESAGL